MIWNCYSFHENIVDMSHVGSFVIVNYISHMTLNREESGGAVRPVASRKNLECDKTPREPYVMSSVPAAAGEK